MRHGAELPFRVADGCVIVRVRVTPKSSLDAVGRISQTADGPALSIRVRAVPSEGEANAALVRLMAGWLDVPIRSVRVSAGPKSRVKMLTIDGDGAALATRIAQKLEPEPAKTSEPGRT